jgi:hypothetical protein
MDVPKPAARKSSPAQSFVPTFRMTEKETAPENEIIAMAKGAFAKDVGAQKESAAGDPCGNRSPESHRQFRLRRRSRYTARRWSRVRAARALCCVPLESEADLYRRISCRFSLICLAAAATSYFLYHYHKSINAWRRGNRRFQKGEVREYFARSGLVVVPTGIEPVFPT